MAHPMLDNLAKLPICRGLTPAQVQELAGAFDETQAPAGTTLFAEGKPGDHLLVLVEGQVEVIKGGQTLATLSDGSVLGEMSLVSGGEARSATARAVTSVKLLKLGTERFSALLAKDNITALKVVANLAQVMCKRLSLLNEKFVESVGKGKKKEELADFERLLNNWTF